MKLSSELDVDVVAMQQDDAVTCLLTFAAPAANPAEPSPGETLIVVVDRSGSMSGEPLEAVRSSMHGLVDRLRPQDTFGVVIFDERAEVLVPPRPMSDHHTPSVHHLLDLMHAGGTTDLSAGYLLGLGEASRHLGATGASLLLLSDGHANAGLTDPQVVGKLAAQARADRISTTTIGIGSGYDETLLAEMARQGSGVHRFAFTPDDAAAVLAEEAGDLLSKVVVNAFVRITPSDPDHLGSIGLLEGIPQWIETGPDGAARIVVPLGDLYAGEQREQLINFAVPAIGALGPVVLASIDIDYVTLPDLKAETITWPIGVNVVAGEEAAKRIPNPTVTVARLIAEANQAKAEASEALLAGDSARAATLMDAASNNLKAQMDLIPDDAADAPRLRARISQEHAQAVKLAESARDREADVSRKSFMEDLNAAGRGDVDEMRQQRRRGKRDF